MAAVGEAAIDVGEREVGMQLDRLIEVGDGAVVVTLGFVGQAAIVVGEHTHLGSMRMASVASAMTRS